MSTNFFSRLKCIDFHIIAFLFWGFSSTQGYWIPHFAVLVVWMTLSIPYRNRSESTVSLRLSLKAMVIAVNTRFLLKEKLEGFGYFTKEVISRLVADHPDHQFYFFVQYYSACIDAAGPPSPPLEILVWHKSYPNTKENWRWYFFVAGWPVLPDYQSAPMPGSSRPWIFTLLHWISK